MVCEQENSSVLYKVPYNPIWSFSMLNANPMIGCDSGELLLVSETADTPPTKVDKMVRESILTVKLDQATNLLAIAS